MGYAHGVRLSKQRIREIGWFESDAGAALACLQAQSYVPTSGGTDPGRLLAQERFVQRSSNVTARVARVVEVREALFVDPEGRPVQADVTLHWARVARVCQYLWTRVRSENASRRDEVFGRDLVPIVGESRSARARGRIAWPSWVCGERPWITERSRIVTAKAQAMYDEDIRSAKAAATEAHGLEDEHPWAKTYAPVVARAACLARFDRWEQAGYGLDHVVEDVIDRAIAPNTFDDALVTAVRTEADELLSASSVAVQGAWNEVDGRRAVAEERARKGDTEQTAARKERLRRLRSTVRPLPTTNVERAERLGELVERMRVLDVAGGSR